METYIFTYFCVLKFEVILCLVSVFQSVFDIMTASFEISKHTVGPLGGYFILMWDLIYWMDPSCWDSFCISYCGYHFHGLFLSLTTLVILPRLKYYPITFVYLTIPHSLVLRWVIIEGSITPLAAGGFISSAKCCIEGTQIIGCCIIP